MVFKKYTYYFLACLLSVVQTNGQDHPLKLWYTKPAVRWTEALPIGNGKLGAMIFGGIEEDHLQFNEETFWSSGPRHYEREGAVQSLSQIRTLLDQGKQKEAEALAEAEFMGTKSHPNYPQLKDGWIRQVRIKPLPVYGSDWKEMNVPIANGWEANGLPGLDGAVVFRKTFHLPEAWQGKDLVLNLGRIRDDDASFINGKNVGSTTGSDKDRIYHVKASDLRNGENEIMVQILNYNDKGGFVTPRANEKTLSVALEAEPQANPIKINGVWNYKIVDQSPPGFPKYQADYQPFADLWIRSSQSGTVTGYTRELDLTTATGKVSYSLNGVRYTREYFSSAPGQAIFVRISADKPGRVNLSASLSSLHRDIHRGKKDAQTVWLSFLATDGVLKGRTYLRVIPKNGSLKINADSIVVDKADEVVFQLTGSTSFVNYHDVSADPKLRGEKILESLKSTSYTEALKSHTDEYAKMFGRFYVKLGKEPSPDLPTDERIIQFKNKFDPSLVELYIQYGRYLLISSSRPGTQAANLQGIWNNLITPPWGSKYTANINLEMNYWGAEMLNLSECAFPLFDMIDDLKAAGALTAKAHYGAPGWVLHHNTDLWRGTAPINAANHGIWMGGSGWLSRHLWEHYLFTLDKEFLAKRAYPAMKSAAEFYVSVLYKDPASGYLISSPSNSPEQGGLVAGPSMDHEIIRDLFKNCIAADSVLKTDAAFSAKLKAIIPEISPNKIGRYGQLQEWVKDIDDTSNKHRHVSHLWAVYPGTDITWDSSPEFMKAAERSLVYRGDSGTGWSLSWKINLWARFKQGDHALEMVKLLLNKAEGENGAERGGVYTNLFDAHPPFQIDGNFGGSAGVAEMLLQSHEGYLDLFSALPAALPDGEIRGLVARGGFEVSFVWSNGKMSSLEILSRAGMPLNIHYGNKRIGIPTVKNKRYLFDGDLKQKS